MPIARATGSAALSVRLDIRQLRHQRANASHDVGLFVPEVVEERTQRRTQEAELVIAEFESVHGREPNARAPPAQTSVWIAKATTNPSVVTTPTSFPPCS